MTITEILSNNRGELEIKLRNLLAKPVLLIEMDAFALPCGCKGATINTRGLQYDDLEIFEEHIGKYLKETSENLEIEPSFLFARLVPGTAEVASLNSRVLCNRCYMDLPGAVVRSRDLIYIYLTLFVGNKSPVFNIF